MFIVDFFLHPVQLESYVIEMKVVCANYIEYTITGLIMSVYEW